MISNLTVILVGLTEAADIPKTIEKALESKYVCGKSLSTMLTVALQGGEMQMFGTGVVVDDLKNKVKS